MLQKRRSLLGDEDSSLPSYNLGVYLKYQYQNSRLLEDFEEYIDILRQVFAVAPQTSSTTLLVGKRSWQMLFIITIKQLISIWYLRLLKSARKPLLPLLKTIQINHESTTG